MKEYQKLTFRRSDPRVKEKLPVDEIIAQLSSIEGASVAADEYGAVVETELYADIDVLDRIIDIMLDHDCTLFSSCIVRKEAEGEEDEA